MTRIKVEQFRQDELRKPVVYKKDSAQINPQKAFIELSEDGTVGVGYSGEIGNAVPVSVWHGVDRRYPISPYLTGDGCNQLIEDAVLLLQRIHDGLSVEWDGSNYIGRLNDDAMDAEEDLAALCNREYEEAAVCDASSFLRLWECDPNDIWPDAKTWNDVQGHIAQIVEIMADKADREELFIDGGSQALENEIREHCYRHMDD